MKLTISEAARRAGVKRQLLYRQIGKGLLSKEINEDGSPAIDLSELARVYPQAARYTGQEDKTEGQAIGRIVTDDGQQENRFLRERIAALEADKADLRRDLDHERDERGRLLALVERQAETVRHLTDQRTATQAAPAAVKRRSLWARLTGWR